MQRLEVSCAVRRIYTSLGAKGLKMMSINGCGMDWNNLTQECVLWKFLVNGNELFGAKNIGSL